MPIVSRKLGALGRGSGITVVALGVVSACSSEIGVEDTIPAEPGIVMPDGGGSPIDESAACSRLLTAVEEARTRLRCPAETAACPALVRPAGSQACLQFDEATVEACEGVIGRYTRCSDFDSRRCIVSALPGTTSPGCVAPPIDAGDDGEADAAPDGEADSAEDVSEGDSRPGDAGDGGGSDGAADAAAG